MATVEAIQDLHSLPADEERLENIVSLRVDVFLPGRRHAPPLKT